MEINENTAELSDADEAKKNKKVDGPEREREADTDGDLRSGS